MSPKPAADLERQCTVSGCGRLYADHRAGLCPFCNGPLDHHAPGMLEACRSGKARMARAREAAGIPLTDADRRALSEVA